MHKNKTCGPREWGWIWNPAQTREVTQSGNGKKILGDKRGVLNDQASLKEKRIYNIYAFAGEYDFTQNGIVFYTNLLQI